MKCCWLLCILSLHYGSCLSISPTRSPNSKTKGMEWPKLVWVFAGAGVTAVPVFSSVQVRVRLLHRAVGEYVWGWPHIMATLGQHLLFCACLASYTLLFRSSVIPILDVFDFRWAFKQLWLDAFLDWFVTFQQELNHRCLCENSFS